jgi:hypothetical protein
MTPWEYASRYLPIQVPGPMEAYPINISRYRLWQSSEPPAAQQSFYTAVGDYLSANQKKNKAFTLNLSLDKETVQVASRQEILMSLVRPFYGKGSPEDCQIVLQLALTCNMTKPELLQDWANKHLGLDCNGFVGNYLFHDVMKQSWRVNATDKQPGPSTDISTIFRYASGARDTNALDDLAKIEVGRLYLIARVNDAGQVIPGGPNSVGAGRWSTICMPICARSSLG